MTKIKKDRYEKDFTLVKNNFIKDVNLSWKAKGVFIFLWSLPDDWDFRERELKDHAKDGIGALSSAVKELRTAHYVEISRDMKGHTSWILHEVPTKPIKKPRSENPNKEKPNKDNRHVYKGLRQQRTKTSVGRKPVNKYKPRIMQMITTYFNVSGVFLGDCSKTVDDWLDIYPPEVIIAAVDSANKQQLMRGTKIRRATSYINVILESKKNASSKKRSKPKQDVDGSLHDIKAHEAANDAKVLQRIKSGNFDKI